MHPSSFVALDFKKAGSHVHHGAEDLGDEHVAQAEVVDVEGA